ncbi:hypothetical protein SNE40_014767 [Patella caerulea]|uniref:Homeobox domain-containing protein n=1 Tax=Patella caerulea TaxID=87958 RepID=A0AAN8PDH7_PATCE
MSNSNTESSGHYGNKLKRNRTYFSPFQTKAMEEVFRNSQFPDKQQIENLSRHINIPDRSLQVWFQNRRARLRKASPRSLTELMVESFDNSAPGKKTSISKSRLESKSHPYFPIPKNTPNTSAKHEHKVKEEPEQKIRYQWHRTQDTETTSNKESTTPARIENCHVKWGPPERGQSDSGSTPPISESSVEEIKSPEKLNDDYTFMQMNYQTSCGNVLDLSSSSNLCKTPSPKSSKTAFHSPILQPSPDEHSSVLNLCMRDNSETEVRVRSPSKSKSPKVAPAALFPNVVHPYYMYGYPPGVQCFPPIPMQPYHPAMFPHPNTLNQSELNRVTYFPLPYPQEITIKKDKVKK